MKRHFIRIFTALAVVAICVATGSAQEPKLELKTLVEKVSYGIGLNIGRDMKSQELDLNTALLIKGITDGIGGKDGALTEEDLRAAMVEFQGIMRAKMEKKQTEASAKNIADGQKFLAENAKKPGVTVLESGLQYKVIKAGNGPSPTKDDRVSTHYHGTLMDGTVFDSSVQRGQPASFGVGQVIPGWTEALQKMKVGDKWQLVIPSNLAYGERGTGPIGPNSVLVFEVELLKIHEAVPAPR
jgi:FKBP-type peptidyl-prolyl cis-trans isomerase FklB